MKIDVQKCLPVFLFLFFSFNILTAQKDAAANFLQVRISAEYDYASKKQVYQVNAETGSDAAGDIYALKKYDFKKGAVNNTASFYYEHKDTATATYNYFSSATEAVNFILKRGWVLTAVFTEVFSGYNNERDGKGDLVPLTTVSSRPVYCFKK